MREGGGGGGDLFRSDTKPFPTDIKLDKVLSQDDHEQHLPANEDTPIPNGHMTHIPPRERHMSPVSQVELEEIKLSDQTTSQQENSKPQIEDEDNSYFEVLMVDT